MDKRKMQPEDVSRGIGMEKSESFPDEQVGDLEKLNQSYLPTSLHPIARKTTR
ncbi:hypothetical protein GTO91_05445 [Heliobacterium undosum]|uniref:Uncharacterized protein n=1 Tax=Heliomicrobium undosum TaxID=121734 RepID=A0A845L2T5_9FIRM|nr:hypothetical protein [Heliomicrobium undosum]MZP29154.1 hypothetical protein [Heliomicrobium undosum]